MNLAARLYLNEVQRDALCNELEAMLTALFSGWQSWDFVKPATLMVYGAFESATAAARIFALGFEACQLHDHRAGERLISCRCRMFEI